MKVPHGRSLRPRAFSCEGYPLALLFSCEGYPLALPGPGPAHRSCNNRPRSLVLPEAFIP